MFGADPNKSNVPIRGYQNKSNIFSQTEPSIMKKSNKTYHLDSDIYFQKPDKENQKNTIKKGIFNKETTEEVYDVKGTRKKIINPVFEESKIVQRKITKERNSVDPDNTMAHDFSNGPSMKVKTCIKFNPFKLQESEAPVKKGKKILVEKKKEDANSSIKLDFQ